MITVCASESSCEDQIHIINVKYLVLNKCWLLIRLCVVDLALSKSDWGTKVLMEGSQIRFEGNQEEGNIKHEPRSFWRILEDSRGFWAPGKRGRRMQKCMQESESLPTG